jgi:hypothetical protein
MPESVRRAVDAAVRSANRAAVPTYLVNRSPYTVEEQAANCCERCLQYINDSIVPPDRLREAC